MSDKSNIEDTEDALNYSADDIHQIKENDDIQQQQKDDFGSFDDAEEDDDFGDFEEEEEEPDVDVRSFKWECHRAHHLTSFFAEYSHLQHHARCSGLVAASTGPNIPL